MNKNECTVAMWPFKWLHKILIHSEEKYGYRKFMKTSFCSMRKMFIQLVQILCQKIIFTHYRANYWGIRAMRNLPFEKMWRCVMLLCPLHLIDGAISIKTRVSQMYKLFAVCCIKMFRSLICHLLMFEEHILLP